MLTNKTVTTTAPCQASPTGLGTVRRLRSSRDIIYLYEYEGCSLRYDSEYLNFLFELDDEAKKRTTHKYFELPFSVGGIWNFGKNERHKIVLTLYKHINIALGQPCATDLTGTKYGAFAEYIEYLLTGILNGR